MYRNSNDPSHKEYYKKYCQVLSTVIKLATKHYYNKLLLESNNKPKTTWNIVKTITNSKNTIYNIPPMNINNKISSNPLVTANAFNTYFSSAAENLLINNFYGKDTNNNDPVTYLWQNFSQFSSSIKLNNATTYEIGKIIHSWKCRDSHGYDEITSRIFKIRAPYVLSTLTYIFNKILLTGIFPERLKFSEEKPLFKKGDITDFSNYKTISLLTSFSKIIEKNYI